MPRDMPGVVGLIGGFLGLLLFSVPLLGQSLEQSLNQLHTSEGTRYYLAQPDFVLFEYRLTSELVDEPLEIGRLYGDGRFEFQRSSVYLDHGRYEFVISASEVSAFVESVIEAKSQQTAQNSNVAWRYADQEEASLNLNLYDLSSAAVMLQPNIQTQLNLQASSRPVVMIRHLVRQLVIDHRQSGP